MTKIHVSLPGDTEKGLQVFTDEIDGRLASDEDTCMVVRGTLIDLFDNHEAWERWQNGKSVSSMMRTRLQGYGPCNAMLKAEYYAEKDEVKFKRSKRLWWLWRQFDATPMADDVTFAPRLRQTLMDHLLAGTGNNLRVFESVTFSYDHNISIDDNAAIRDNVHLDDREKLTIGDRASISDSTHIYSYSYDTIDQIEVRNYHMAVGDNAYVAYNVMVSTGVSVGEGAIIDARLVVRGGVPAHHIAVDSSVRNMKVKPGSEEVAELLDARDRHHADERETPYELPSDIETSNGFDRGLDGPMDSYRHE